VGLDFLSWKFAENYHFRDLTVAHLLVPHRINFKEGVLPVIKKQVRNDHFRFGLSEVPIIDANFHDRFGLRLTAVGPSRLPPVPHALVPTKPW